MDSDDENLVVGGGLDQHPGGGLDHLEPQGADGGASPQPNLASAVMPPEMYETEWEAFQLSIQRLVLEIICSKLRLIFLFSPVGEPDLLDLQDLGSDSTVFYQKNLPNLGFPQVGNQLQWRSGLT